LKRVLTPLVPSGSDLEPPPGRAAASREARRRHLAESGGTARTRSRWGALRRCAWGASHRRAGFVDSSRCPPAHAEPPCSSSRHRNSRRRRADGVPVLQANFSASDDYTNSRLATSASRPSSPDGLERDGDSRRKSPPAAVSRSRSSVPCRERVRRGLRRAREAERLGTLRSDFWLRFLAHQASAVDVFGCRSARSGASTRRRP